MENEMGAKVVLYISWRDKEEGLKGTWYVAKVCVIIMGFYFHP
jgi:hypothetical protein